MPLTEQQLEALQTQFDSRRYQSAPNPIVVQNDSYIASGHDISGMYGGTPQPDVNFVLDWIGARGGLAKKDDVRKVLGSTLVNMTTGTIASLMQQGADRIRAEEPTLSDMFSKVGDGDISAIWDYVSAVPMFGVTNYIHEHLTNIGFTKKLEDTAQSLRDWNKRFLVENNLALGPGEEPTLLYNVVSGGASLLASLGIGVITQSPATAAAVFGTVQQTDAYTAYREAGTDVEKAQALATLEGITVGYIEMIGMGQWLNTIIGRGSSPMRGMMRGAMVNFQEEFSQAGAEEFFRKMGGINENTALESLKSMFGQGVTGSLVGGPVGMITGPMETRGIKKAYEGGDYREALAETIVGRLADDMDADMAARLDAVLDKSQTESGKKYAEVFQDIAKIADAFNTGIDIGEVYQTKEQRENFVTDMVSRIDEARNRKMVDERAGRRRILKEQESDILGKISDVEKEGAEFTAGFLENFRELGYSEKTIQAIEDAAYMIGLAQESAVEAVDTGKDSADIQFEDIMEFIDEAEYRAEIDDMRQQMTIDDALESATRYVNIQRKAGKLGEKLRVLREELNTLESTPDSELESIVGKEYIRIRGNVIEKVRKNEAVQSFQKGFKEGKKYSAEQISSVQSALLEGIQSLKGSGVSDQLIEKLLRRIPRVKTESQLSSLIEKVDVLIEADIIRVAKETSIADTQKIIKRYASSKAGGKQVAKLDARITDAIDLMYKAQKKIRKGTRRKEGESISEYRYRKADKMMKRLNEYNTQLMQMASEEQDSPMPDSAKNVAMQYITSLVAEPTISEQIALEQSVRAMVGLGRDVRSEAIERNQTEIDRNVKQVLAKTKTDKKRDPDSLREKFMEAIKQPGNLIVKSYNTLLDQMGLSDIPLLKQMESLNLKNAENRIVNDNNLIELIKKTVGAKYFSDEYRKKGAFAREDIKIGKQRVLEYIVNAEDLVEAKGVVLKYIGHRGGQEGFGEVSARALRRAVSEAQTLDELGNIVDGMVDDRKSSYSIDWSKGEHIYWYMLLQNEQLRESIMAPWGDMAMDESLVAEIESELTEQDKQLADALFGEYEKMYGKINQVYRRMYGVSLPKVDFYTPISREAANGSDAPLDPVNDFTHYISASFTKVRTSNAIQIKDQDAVDVYLKHVRNAQHWVDYAEWFQKTTSVLAATSKDIVNKHGKSAHDALLQHVQDMQSAHNIEMNTQLDMLDYFRRAFMLSTLGANPQIGIKQLTSIFAMADGMSSTDFVSYINEFMENPVKNFQLMREHVTFKYRGERFNKELDTIINDKKMRVGGKFSFQDLMMLPVRVGDAIPVYLGGYAQYRNAIENGASHRQALDIASRKVEASQQTSIEANLSVWQKKNESLYRIIGMFTSSPLALLNMEMQAVYQYKNGAIDNNQLMRKLAIYHVIIPAFFTWVASAFDADEEEYAKSFILGTTGSVPIISAPLDIVVTKGVNMVSKGMGRDNQLPVFERTLADSPLFDAANKTLRLNIEDAINDITSKDPVTMAEGISAVADALDWASTFPSENLADMTTGMLEMFSDSRDPYEGWLKFIGFSQYTIDQDEE